MGVSQLSTRSRGRPPLAVWTVAQTHRVAPLATIRTINPTAERRSRGAWQNRLISGEHERQGLPARSNGKKSDSPSPASESLGT